MTDAQRVVKAILDYLAAEISPQIAERVEEIANSRGVVISTAPATSSIYQDHNTAGRGGVLQ